MRFLKTPSESLDLAGLKVQLSKYKKSLCLLFTKTKQIPSTSLTGAASQPAATREKIWGFFFLNHFCFSFELFLRMNEGGFVLYLTIQPWWLFKVLKRIHLLRSELPNLWTCSPSLHFPLKILVRYSTIQASILLIVFDSSECLQDMSPTGPQMTPEANVFGTMSSGSRRTALEP